MAQKYSEPLDVIYCSHVIEHIPDPSHWMRRFREVMALDGVLCLAVPNMNSIDRRRKRLLKCLGLGGTDGSVGALLITFTSLAKEV